MGDEKIRVAVLGAAGRMGATVCRAVLDAPDMELVAVVDPPHEGRPLDDFGVAGTGLTLSMLGPQVKAAAPAVAVDFTHVEAARGNLRWCALNGVHAVVGTTGLTGDDFHDLTALFDGERANAVIVQGVLTASAWQTGNLAVRHHLPALSVTKQFAQSGGLMSYSGSFTDIYRRAASYVDRILKAPSPPTCPSSNRRSSSW